jgi:hypothetical protein
VLSEKGKIESVEFLPQTPNWIIQSIEKWFKEEVLSFLSGELSSSLETYGLLLQAVYKEKSCIVSEGGTKKKLEGLLFWQKCDG